MKKSSIIYSFMTFCMMLFALVGFAQVNTNGGFESWSDTWPDGWHGNKTNITASNVVLVTSGAHSGNNACQLINTTTSLKRLSTQPISVSNGEQYVVSFWVKGTGDIRVGLYDNDPQSSGGIHYLDYHNINSAQYVYCEDTIIAQNTLSNAEFLIGVKNTVDNNDNLIVDDVTVTAVTSSDFVAEPTVTLTGNMHSTDTYFGSATVSMSAENGASIYYTLDGTTPDVSSTLYAAPFTVTQTTTLKAIAILNGNSSSVVTKNITILELNPLFYENFETSGLNQMSVTNVSGTYAWNTASHDGNNYAYANAYNQGATETWLITPAITPLNAGGVELTFSSAKNYIGPDIQVKYSTDYSGTGSPTSATWTDLTSLCTLSSGSWTWTESGEVAIAGSAPVCFAWVYTSESSSAAGWEIDNIMVTAGNAPAPTPTLAITAPANGSQFSSLDTLPVGVSIQNFTLGTDGYLKVETPLLVSVGLTSPAYLDQNGLSVLTQTVFSPLPAGTHTITASLVDMNHNDLTPAISATTTFTVTMPVLNAPVITAVGTNAGADNTFYYSAFVNMAAEQGAAIHYTTDGTIPTESSTLYTAPIEITTTTTFKAIATKANWQSSDVTTFEVTITAPTVDAPVFTPGTGTYADNVTFSIACATDGAVIRYTTDGTTPTESSTLYSNPLTLTATTTVMAKAFKANWLASETATAVYTIVYDPVLSVDSTALSFTSSQITKTFTVSGAHLTDPIVLTCNNSHFTINPDTISNPNSNTLVNVTFDGAEPTTGTITVSSDTLTATVALTATAQLPAPVLTPATGNDTLITVTMSSTVAGAEIRYTTDGTEPTATSTLYTAPVVLNLPGTYTLKAIAVKTGWENSEVTTGTYTVIEPSVGDTVIYAVGFEAEEGFVAGNVYNNTTVAFTGPDGMQWGTYYGTPSTNNHITGAQSMQMRWYASNAGNIAYTNTHFDLRNVTHVTFAATSSNGLKVNVSHSIDGGATFSAGEVFTLGSTANTFDYVVDETGSYDFVRLKFTIVLPETAPTSTSRVVIDSLVVFGIPGVIPTTVSAPVITPNDGLYFEPQMVSITCDNADAVIRYTTDGSVPTESSTVYSAPFTVNTTTTIKAKAWKTGMTPSFVATTTISFPEQVANIAAFKANASNNAQQIMSDVTFVFRNNHYMFVEDNSAALLIYDNSGIITTTYTEGDVIEGGLFGSYQLYNGMVELIPSHNANAATGTPVTVTPTVATASNIINAYASVYESKLVRLNDVVFIDSVTFVQNGDTLSIRDRFNTVDLEISAGDHADVIGFVSYSTQYGYQIYPRDNNDIIISTLETVAKPEFSFQRDGEFYRMTLTCATDGASMYYTIDGSDPDENSYAYTDAVPFLLNVHYVIKAIAMKEGMLNSEIAVYDYDPTGITEFELLNNLTVYPNPAVNNVTISAKDNNIVIEKVELYNIYGQLLSTMKVNDYVAEISVSTLATGTYFAKVFTKQGIVTKPVIRK